MKKGLTNQVGCYRLTSEVGSYKPSRPGGLHLQTMCAHKNNIPEGEFMENLKLCESDYRFMSVIWDNEPLPSGKLVELCCDKLGWKKPTTYTTLKKLCEKGFAQNSDTIVTALIPRERVQTYASEHFVEHTFEGSLPKFLVSFLGGKKLSEKEADELKKLIDEHKED